MEIGVNDAELIANSSAFFVGIITGIALTALAAFIIVLRHTEKLLTRTTPSRQVVSAQDMVDSEQKTTKHGIDPNLLLPNTTVIGPRGIGTLKNTPTNAVRVIDDQEELDWEERKRDDGTWGRVKCKSYKNV
jgi:hypothetical protein